MSGAAVAVAARPSLVARLVAVLGVFVGCVIALPLAVVVAVSGATGSAPAAGAAVADIPPDFLAAYVDAAGMTHLDWAILAAIGKVECDHGRDTSPGCAPGTVNAAGARGPMQFLAATWAQYAASAANATPNVWDIRDAALAAARLLVANGAPGDYRRAIFAYNHADWYVARVVAVAATYRAVLASATASASAPVAWALRFLGTPYVWGGNHTDAATQLAAGTAPSPASGRDGRVGFFDCSSLISWAYAKTRRIWIGGDTREQWAAPVPGSMRGYGVPPGGYAPGDLVFYHDPASAAAHVVLAIDAARFVEAPHTGADVRIGAFADRGTPFGYVRIPQAPSATGGPR